jgi:hypothetical protein
VSAFSFFVSSFFENVEMRLKISQIVFHTAMPLSPFFFWNSAWNFPDWFGGTVILFVLMGNQFSQYWIENHFLSKLYWEVKTGAFCAASHAAYIWATEIESKTVCRIVSHTLHAGDADQRFSFHEDVDSFIALWYTIFSLNANERTKIKSVFNFDFILNLL